jgi:methylmalonyl-CoA carboxyltransferase small subunit
MSAAPEKGSGGLKLQITIDGKAYAVDVEVLEDGGDAAAPGYSARPAAHATDPFARGHMEAWDSEGAFCRSPVMGLVIKVNMEAGQAVEAGELMLVLEAMKMETNVTAPRAGIVKSVHVKPGDPVKVNQLLLEME